MCMFRRSRSLPDSNAANKVADLQDYVSSGANTDAALQKIKKSESANFPDTIGFGGLLPCNKNKDTREFRQHSPLIKLTPFPEAQRRAMVSETLKTTEKKLLELVVDEAGGIDRVSQETLSPETLISSVDSAKHRKSIPCSLDIGTSNVRKRSVTQTELSAEAQRRRHLRHQESIDRVTHYLDHHLIRDYVNADEFSHVHIEQSNTESQPLGNEDQFLRADTTDFLSNQYLDNNNAVSSTEFHMNFLTPEKPEEAVTKRRSSLRRRREDTGEAVLKNPQEEFVKKTVRICSVEEEIQIEAFSIDMEDGLPCSELEEVQLDSTKILTSEELAENIARQEESFKSFSRENVADVSEVVIEMKSLETSVQASQVLKSSASEHLMSGSRPDENKISEKNIKPEILMDLSRVSAEAMDGQGEQCLLNDELLSAGKFKRKLSRVSSDSACMSSSEVKFRITDNRYLDEELPLIRHSQLDLVKFGLEDVPESTPVTLIHHVSKTKLAHLADEISHSDSATAYNFEGHADAQASKKTKSAEEIPLTSSRQEFSTRLRRTCSDGSQSLHQLEDILANPGLKPIDQRLRNRSVSDALVPKEEPPPVSTQKWIISVTRNVTCRGPGDGAEHVVLEDDLSEREPSLIYERTSFENLGECNLGFIDDFEFEAESLDCSSTQSLPSTSYKSYGSPKREVETQTQGEHKSTQYEAEDIASYVGDIYDKVLDPREHLEFLLEAHFGSPRREVEVQTEQECKAVQCISEELEASGEFGPFFRKQLSLTSPRREAQVQTGQDTKSTQCNLEDFFELPGGRFKYQETSRPQFSATRNQRTIECSGSSLESSSPGSWSPPYRAPPLIVLVKGGAKADMTVTHRDKDGNIVWAKHWGPERLVEIYREHQTSLGLSIVGGKVDLQQSSSSSTSHNVTGIFIKNVIPNSPAGRAGGLQTGDRIIEVDGVDLRNSTHERAVKAIQASGNPVRLLVQSLVHLSPEHEGPASDRDGGGGGGGGHRSTTKRQSTRHRMAPDGVSTSSFRHKSSSPEVIQEGRPDFRKQTTGGSSNDAESTMRRLSSMKKSLRKKAPSPPSGSETLRELNEEHENKHKPAAVEPTKNKYSSDESSEEEEDTREMEGNVYTKSGVEISRKSAGNVKRTKEEIAADPEEEDEFGYTTSKVKKKYQNLKKPVFLVKLEKDRRGLGISLAGHKDRNKMAVFICGLNPNGIAFKNGQIQVGDELLEVNGTVFQGRCHLNASSMIKGMAATTFKLVVVRRPSGIENCAVKQVLQFPTALAGEDYSQFKGVRVVPIKKGTYGLGIMIIEGKHAEVGQGIFVSDIQVGSAAEQAGLNVGDMILSVNSDTVMGATYDEATSLLKKAEGIVTLTVCNPNQSKVAEEEERKARGEPVISEKEVAKEPEKPKEPEPPADPKDCKIPNNKDTTIEFPKDKDKPIGLIVIGGNNSPLNSVFVLDVFPDGAAGKDGRLQPGDRIVDVNKESFKSIEQEKAYQTILRITQGPVIMTVHRDEKAIEEYEVELAKKSGKGSGLCLIGYKSGKGAYVSEVVAGGSAAESGKIVKGDRIVAVGGQDLREAPVEDIALHVKVSNPVQLKLARYKSK